MDEEGQRPPPIRHDPEAGTYHADGPFPERMLLSTEYLNGKPYISRVGNVLTIRLAEGSCVYRITGLAGPGTVSCTLVPSVKLDGPGHRGTGG